MRALALLAGLLLATTGCGQTAAPAAAPSRPAPVAAAPVAVPAVEPWLGPPWTLQAAAPLAWPAGRPAGYAFCRASWSPRAPVQGDEQTLVDPSGRTVRLMELRDGTGEETAVQVFKRSYAECLQPGDAESVGGPRTLWRTDTGAAGTELRGEVLRVLDLRDEGRDPRPEVERLFDAWSG